MSVFKSLILAAALIAVPSFAQAECGQGLQAQAPLLNTALHDLEGFGYVREALHKIQAVNPKTELCVSGLILSKDVYQYGQFFIQADIRSTEDNSVISRMRFLFQDASLQAFQNMHKQPWAVIDAQEADSVLNQATQNLSFHPLSNESTDPLILAQASKTFLANPAERGTLMTIAVNIPGVQNAHLVSWLTRNDGNPFATVQQTEGVVVGLDSAGKAVVSENIWVYESIVHPLEVSREARWPKENVDFSGALIQASISTRPTTYTSFTNR